MKETNVGINKLFCNGKVYNIQKECTDCFVCAIPGSVKGIISISKSVNPWRFTEENIKDLYATLLKSIREGMEFMENQVGIDGLTKHIISNLLEIYKTVKGCSSITDPQLEMIASLFKED